MQESRVEEREESRVEEREESSSISALEDEELHNRIVYM